MKTPITLIMIVMIALMGCTTMKEVRPGKKDLTDYFETGDHIVVYEKSGRVVDMQFVLIEDDIIRGNLTDYKLEAVEVKLDDIEKIEAERVAFWRTTGAVVGGIALVPIAVLGGGIGLAGSMQ